MADRPHLIPNADHPITITPNRNRVVVRVGDVVIADTRAALTLQEANYPPVQYIPRGDVDMAQLGASTHTTYCPYKGDAGYFSLPALGDRGADAVWTYDQPYPAVAKIAGHLAFYPDRVTLTEGTTD